MTDPIRTDLIVRLDARAVLDAARAALAEQQVEGPRLCWTENLPPSESCPYDHCIAETPFGRFLITWKSWKEYDSPTVDETPWGDWYDAFNSIDEAKSACQQEFAQRLARCGRAALATAVDGPAVPASREPASVVGESIDDAELDELFTEIDQSGEPLSWRAYARAVLARWGHQPAPPAEGEMGELVNMLTGIAYWKRHGKPGQGDPSPFDIRQADRLTRAAELLQQQQAEIKRLRAQQTPVPVEGELPAAWLYLGEPDFDGTNWRENWCVTTDQQVAQFRAQPDSPVPLFRRPAPQPPAEGEVVELVELLRKEAADDEIGDHMLWMTPADARRAAELLQQQEAELQECRQVSAAFEKFNQQRSAND